LFRAIPCYDVASTSVGGYTYHRVSSPLQRSTANYCPSGK
jgi:hypothetical protein